MNLNISFYQYDIVWEDYRTNLRKISETARSLKGKSHLLALPELCGNGFGCDAVKVAQTNDGPLITTLSQLAEECQLAICGSFVACQRKGDTTCFNRGFFLYPDGRRVFIDKHHLFRIGAEAEHFEAGHAKPQIIDYLGWKIRLIICFELRFPVWCRNRHLEYDLMICVANWPENRLQSWSNMLEARATENQAYACGVNRVGDDPLQLHYCGASAVYSAIGQCLGRATDNAEEVVTVELDQDKLYHQRDRFPSWKSADEFDFTSL